MGGLFRAGEVSVNRASIEAALAEYRDRYISDDLVAHGAVKDLQIEGERVALSLRFGFPLAGYRDTLIQALKAHLAPVVKNLDIRIDFDVAPHVVKTGAKPLPGVKNIIAIASGKGGVGKSTTAVNLALALQKEGATVGILDADIYGPSQPIMLGKAGAHPESKDQKSIEPVLSHGVQSMSIGYLVDPDQAMVWRGPMVSQALQQLLNDTRWRDLDYLIVDLPPGTGDVQLTLSQKVPLTAAIIVTTPQDIALADAIKGVAMFKKVDVPVLGVIENMAMHICSNCGHQEPVFGQGGGEKLAAQYGVEMLGALPLDIRIRQQADGGAPSVAAEPEGDIAGIYRDIARRIGAKLSFEAKNYAAMGPSISIVSE
ncbi:iron-sulfur cluster carrier protein ApbC [Permianibacter aggregans]|uniref:iron-sulfur cluster carrier protein ApbC n=1 Tax=Permianibacter aggregans TaxID=1510150 RepID=UPI0018DF0460|nr:iron-sulfur cluster carrier protein ApbC [Permianibacter aggregans]